MNCRPAIQFDSQIDRPKVSVILIDWKARESFHSLHYLNRQSAPRSDYELIWVEFYDHRPEGLRRAVAEHPGPRPLLDRWITLGYPDDTIYHKHRMYNLGLVAARGHVCVICDSDAMFTPNFISRIVRHFEDDPDAVMHLDQIRTDSRDHYPFDYPPFERVLGSAFNWWETATRGLHNDQDRIHRANYGACLAARRRDLLAVGGADEHLDYLGYICGPYDLTFRLVNHHARPDVWLKDEYLYHTWHPNTSGFNTEYAGPEDGRLMSLRALDARARCRVEPYARSPLLPAGRREPALHEALALLAARPEPAWKAGTQPDGSDDLYWAAKDYRGYNLYCHRRRWFGLPLVDGVLELARAEAGGYPRLLRADSEEALQKLIEQHPVPAPSGLLGRLMRAYHTHPVERWPGRLWRAAKKALRKVNPPAAPWPTAARQP